MIKNNRFLGITNFIFIFCLSINIFGNLFGNIADNNKLEFVSS